MAAIIIVFFVFFKIILSSIFVLPVPTLSQSSYKIIPLGSSLSSTGTPSSWSSQSGHFAFGFFWLSGNLYAGIWFAKTPQNQTIWTANRDKPAPNGSTIELTAEGRLRMKDQDGNEVMEIASSPTGGVSQAALLDNGNLVLLSSDQTKFKWESFDHPTDTIVLGQTIDRSDKHQLVSPVFSGNVSSGRFFLWMLRNGNVAIDLIRKPEDQLWVYQTNTGGYGDRLVYNETNGLIYVSLNNGSMFGLTPPAAIPVPADAYYHKATLEYDGIFRQYVFPKNKSSPSWIKVWSSMDNPCEVPTLCGLNGYCVNSGSNSTETFDCLCPTNFSFVDSSYKFFGCKPDFPATDCGRKPEDYQLIEYQETDWPGNDYDMLTSIQLENCRAVCLSDCLCTAATHRHDLQRCWLKKLPLTRGRKHSSYYSVTAFIKVPKNNISDASNAPNCRDSRKIARTLFILSWTIVGGLLLLNLSLLAGCWVRRRQNHAKYSSRNTGQATSWSGNLRSFSYDELAEATKGFNDEIGRGSFGAVYRGNVDEGKIVAVKKLEKLVGDGEMEFRAELNVIGRTHHKNLVELIGFCDQGSNRLLVYDFMENGSLSSFLYAIPRQLGWSQRIQIALGIAKGLSYLHEECSTQILHCDIKPGNILLDGEFTPKIADFGLAKLLRHDQTRTLTDIRGTRGYVAPEWFTKMAVSTKVDVYSFGVMLLEIICCRKNLDVNKINHSSAVLVDWAYECYLEERLDLLLTADDEDAKRDRRMFVRMVMVALWCIQQNPLYRPTMKKVVHMIEGTVDVEEPPANSCFR